MPFQSDFRWTAYCSWEGLDTLASAWGIAGFHRFRPGFCLSPGGRRAGGRHHLADLPRLCPRALHQWYVDGIVSRNFSELDTSNMSGVMERELANNRTAIASTMVNSHGQPYELSDDPDFALAAMVVTMDGGNHHTGQGSASLIPAPFPPSDPELIPCHHGLDELLVHRRGRHGRLYGERAWTMSRTRTGRSAISRTSRKMRLDTRPCSLAGHALLLRCLLCLILPDCALLHRGLCRRAIDTWTARGRPVCGTRKSLSLNTQESEVVALYATDLATYISEEVPQIRHRRPGLCRLGRFYFHLRGGCTL